MSHTSGSHSQADRHQLILLFLKPIQPSIIGVDSYSCRLAVDSTLLLRKSNPTEVYEVLKGLKPNKATGCDLITPELVQKLAEALSQPFSTLLNYILDHATVPSQWKLDEISPVHKKDCNLRK